MQVDVKEVSSLTKEITVVLPAELVQNKMNKAYDKLQKESKMKGFRRGKVPRSVIVKNFKEQVEAEVGEKLVQESYFDALAKTDIEPVVHPDVQQPVYSEDGSFTYTATVDIKPEFELGAYKGLEIEKPSSSVSDAEIDAEIESMRVDMAPLASVEGRSIVNGDVALVDFEGFHNDKPMKQVKSENFSIEVGSGKVGAEFEEKLVGMEKGQKDSLEVDFPEKFANPILAGKKVEFRVVVKDIKERLLQEINDEFAKDVNSEFETVEDMRTSIGQTISQQKEEKAEGDLTDIVMHKLLENNDFEVPGRLVQYEVNEMIKQTEESLKQQGLDMESAGINLEELAASNKDTAEKRVRGDFVLKKIAEVEEIKVNDEDVERGFKRIGDQYNMSVSKVKEFFQSRDDLFPFMNELLNEKVLNFLRTEANFVEVKADPEKVEENA